MGDEPEDNKKVSTVNYFKRLFGKKDLKAYEEEDTLFLTDVKLKVGDILEFSNGKGWGVYCGKLPAEDWYSLPSEPSIYSVIHFDKKCDKSNYCIHDLRDILKESGTTVKINNFQDDKYPHIPQLSEKDFQQRILNELEDSSIRFRFVWNRSKYYASLLRYGKGYANSSNGFVTSVKVALASVQMALELSPFSVFALIPKATLLALDFIK